MMTAAQQYRRFGACVEAQDGLVILQVGHELVALGDSEDARAFMFQLAAAYYAAARQGAGGAEPAPADLEPADLQVAA